MSVLNVNAILFDMDGTLINSTSGVEGAWHVFKETYPDIDVHNILSSAHGVRTIDNLRKYCNLTDPDELERESERFEQAIVTSSQAEGSQGIICLPGVKNVLEEIGPLRALPKPSWAICTSATRAYATAALSLAQIPVPDVFVVAEDVEKGKPFPDPYLLGAAKCRVSPSKCLVFEDSPNGILSGKAAGCKTVAFLTTHSRAQMEACNPDFIVQDMAR
ncbi:HAD-like domain-containing protein [Mycena floridula]|nr:HAD-like domain-containing protein [Mycena floridula]